MKKLFFILSIISVTVISSCDDNSFDGCVQVKMINQLCGTAIYQIVGGDVPDGVANSWTDNNGVTYENVFTTTISPCDVRPENGDIFYVKIVEEQQPSNCAQCLALLADAPEQRLFTVISDDCNVDSSDL
ncbi:MAG: hypothetical protein HWE07_11430 [Cytophagia bacterium]|nr:hypothetical protein [Cytophagia bacterium]